MQIIIVSGFLGSGKTTFIEEFQKRLENVAILENDYAKANVDYDILANTGKDILSLEEGCVCCSKKKDFATTVITIENTIDPDYLIIEPTGVGYLSNIIANIKSIEYEKIKLLNPITIVDYNSVDSLIRNYEDLFLDQIKNSGYLLLSKT
ncbi:GTP-binding protein [Anaerococcus sp.]|nr:GTP-binding protein [Anaerococcus sp.]MDU1828300.1 GTP-binding protein [Anaerococcus sp.]MDU1864381.1 GTP-binding protein [Anaerococcus sp.]